MAYYTIDPFGEERGDLRSGVAAAGLASVQSGKRFKPTDFMPSFGGRRKMTGKEMYRTMLAYTKSVGGKDLRKKK